MWSKIGVESKAENVASRASADICTVRRNFLRQHNWNLLLQALWKRMKSSINHINHHHKSTGVESRLPYIFLLSAAFASWHPDSDDHGRSPPLLWLSPQSRLPTGQEHCRLPPRLQPRHLLLGHHGGQEHLLPVVKVGLCHCYQTWYSLDMDAWIGSWSGV